MKLWTVIWSDEGRIKFGVENSPELIPLDDGHGIEFNENKIKRGRPKMRVADVYPFFKTEIEAEAFRCGNNDFKAVPVEIEFER